MATLDYRKLKAEYKEIDKRLRRERTAKVISTAMVLNKKKEFTYEYKKRLKK